MVNMYIVTKKLYCGGKTWRWAGNILLISDVKKHKEFLMFDNILLDTKYNINNIDDNSTWLTRTNDNLLYCKSNDDYILMKTNNLCFILYGLISRIHKIYRVRWQKLWYTQIFYFLLLCLHNTRNSDCSSFTIQSSVFRTYHLIL